MTVAMMERSCWMTRRESVEKGLKKNFFFVGVVVHLNMCCTRMIHFYLAREH